MNSVVLFLFVAAEYCIYLWCYFFTNTRVITAVVLNPTA